MTTVPVVGSDGTAEALDFVASGRMLCTVMDIATWQAGYMVVRVFDAANGWVPSPVERAMNTMGIIATKDNSPIYLRDVATATDSGLIVPVIRNADQRTLVELAGEIRRLSDATRAGKAINVEVLDALASLTRAQTQNAAALYNYNVAAADLLRATGQR